MLSIYDLLIDNPDGYLSNVLHLNNTYHCQKFSFSQSKTWTNHLICKLIAVPHILKYYIVWLQHPYLLAGRTPVPQTSQQESLMIALSKGAIKIDCVKLSNAFYQNFILCQQGRFSKIRSHIANIAIRTDCSIRVKWLTY